MLYHRKIGEADVWNITELHGPTHDPLRLFPDLPANELADIVAQLGQHQWCEQTGRLIVGVQIWICRIAQETVIIDTGVGNHKTRGLPRFNQLNTLVPDWLDAVGAGRDAVTHVINTHLHGDHVGWNTTSGERGWEAWFRQAQYWMPAKDYAFWKPQADATPGRGETECFADAIDPLVQQGRVTFFAAGDEIIPGLTIHAAPGHTPGQVRIDVRSAGMHGSFCGDIFHSPLQILRPDINTVIDVEPDSARQTRLSFLDEMAQTGALVMPCHFGFPHCGYIQRHGERYRFVPEQGEDRMS